MPPQLGISDPLRKNGCFALVSPLSSLISFDRQSIVRLGLPFTHVFPTDLTSTPSSGSLCAMRYRVWGASASASRCKCANFDLAPIGISPEGGNPEPERDRGEPELIAHSRNANFSRTVRFDTSERKSSPSIISALFPRRIEGSSTKKKDGPRKMCEQ